MTKEKCSLGFALMREALTGENDGYLAAAESKRMFAQIDAKTSTRQTSTRQATAKALKKFSFAPSTWIARSCPQDSD